MGAVHTKKPKKQLTQLLKLAAAAVSIEQPKSNLWQL